MRRKKGIEQSYKNIEDVLTDEAKILMKLRDKGMLLPGIWAAKLHKIDQEFIKHDEERLIDMNFIDEKLREMKDKLKSYWMRLRNAADR